MNQISIMDSIYGGAFATIVDLNGKSAKSGLPGVTAGKKRFRQRKVTFGRNQLVSTLPDLDQQRESSTWDRQAWTFQEGMFSRRLLLFSYHQVYFVCYKLKSSEASCGEGEAHRNGPRSRMGWAMPYGVFTQSLLDDVCLPSWDQKYGDLSSVIEKYARRNLSKESDTLNAVSGLLHCFESRWFPEGFFFGLPKHDFRHSLGWDSRSQKFTESRRRTTFPSWSWAGWHMDGEFRFQRGYMIQQPPLSIWTCEGEKLNVDSSSVEFDDDDSGSESDMRSAMDDVIDNFEKTSVVDRRAPQRRPEPSILTITGLILQLKFLLDIETGAMTTDRGGDPCELQGLNGVLLYGVANLQRNGEIFRNQKTSIFAKTVFPECTEDFLLLSIDGTFADYTQLNLILLEWRDAIAYRRGFVTFHMDCKDANILVELRPKLTKFLLG